MSACTTKGCDNEARMAIRTVRPERPGLKSTVWYDDRAAPATASPYCKTCGSKLLHDLVNTLVSS